MRVVALMAALLPLAGCMAAADAGMEQPQAAPAGQVEDAAPAIPPPQTGEASSAGTGPGMPQPLTLAQRPNATGGEALYVEHCASCHGPVGMGTGLLDRRLDVAMLEARDNLTAQYVMLVGRRGIGNMPAIPRGEVSDEQLQAIADYLAAGPHVTPEGARQ